MSSGNGTPHIDFLWVYGDFHGGFPDLCFRCFLCRMMSDYKVETVNDGMQEFLVEFRGPEESTCARVFFFLEPI